MDITVIRILRSLLRRRGPRSSIHVSLLLLLGLGIMIAGFYLYAAAAASSLVLGQPTTSSKDSTTNTGTPDVAWHAPTQGYVNNLDRAIDSKGVYGFIFNSSKTPDSDYGTYNYCNMPHVRAKEYVRPNEEYELLYVELVSLLYPHILPLR